MRNFYYFYLLNIKQRKENVFKKRKNFSIIPGKEGKICDQRIKIDIIFASHL
ncbi:MAG: hypothetical protein ACD_79C01080G0002 [uncultured bacterium]|nr:MAG: hypothetical protein ACD_79C01080G0002 [uncultured bacterium]